MLNGIGRLLLMMIHRAVVDSPTGPLVPSLSPLSSNRARALKRSSKV